MKLLKKIYTTSPEELEKVCREILDLKYPKTIVLQGDLGAGKTTFVRTFVKLWDKDILVSSPTFTLMNVYKHKELTIYHFDFYRLSGAEEALELGFEEFLYECDFSFIEWAERAMELIPHPYTSIKISHGDKENERIIFLSIVE